jgi:PKHD-type hydroxylase|tara:strand:+ start:228 stop:773 length:546 start_codon:yes stop_codon:yes gene_type:complete
MRQAWQLWEGRIPPMICEKLIQDCKEELTLRDGTVFSDKDYKPDSSIRKTKLGFTDNSEIRKLIKYYGFEANRSVFNFDVDYIPDAQFGEYSENSFYNWHHDINWQGESMYDRKLSVVIQLTNPDTYEGGCFEFQHVETPLNFKTQGSILVFPSYLSHRVTKVTEGLRYSLVNWLEGPRWR